MSASGCFKFQSDSINTFCGAKLEVDGSYFKFQSDSINTNADSLANRRSRTTLNSNLILLILTTCTKTTYSTTYFKFQSDSINTRETSSTSTKELQPLNSNLILLIPNNQNSRAILDFSLNSNLILLIPNN